MTDQEKFIECHKRALKAVENASIRVQMFTTSIGKATLIFMKKLTDEQQKAVKKVKDYAMKIAKETSDCNHPEICKCFEQLVNLIPRQEFYDFAKQLGNDIFLANQQRKRLASL